MTVTTTAKATGLTPMAFVANVQRSIDFYALLGLTLRNTFNNPQGKLVWAHVQCEAAELMFSLASDPVIPSQQAVLFYLYSPDLVALRNHLLAQGIKISAISYPGYMPKGEMRVEDPDGYVLLIGQAG
jgi:catechol 2,3-dioxygenase-like lactoylglutathione lyase family enzyme